MLSAKLKYLPAGLLVLVFVVVGVEWGVHRPIVAQSLKRTEALSEKEPMPKPSPRVDRQGNRLPPGAVARLGSLRFRRDGLVGPFAISRDGRTVAATHRWRGKSVVFWDAATGKRTRRMTFEHPVDYLAFSPDGKSLAIGSAGDLHHPDGSLRIVNLESGAEMRRFEGLKNSGILKIASGTFGAAFFTPDGQTLIDLRKDGTVRMWDVPSGKETGKLVGGSWNLWDLSPDGKLLAAVREKSENVIHLLDAVRGTEVRQLKHSSKTSSAAFSPDGKILAVAFGQPVEKGRRRNPEPARIAVWSLESGKSLGFLVGHQSQVTALAFSPDGKTLASGERSSSLRLWDAAAQKEIKKADFAFYSIIRQLAFSRDGKTLFIGGDDNHLRLWDVAAWRERFVEEGPGREITSIVFSLDGELAACASKNSVWLWKTDTGQFVRKLDSASWPILLSADGKSLVVTDRNSQLTSWDLETGKTRPGADLRAPLILRRAYLGNTVAMSPDGKTFASWYLSQFIEVERAGEGKSLPSPKLPAGPPKRQAWVYTLCFSLDGKTLYACGSWKQILRWDVATGNALPRLGEHDGSLSAIALSADGRTLAAMTQVGSLYLWELASGQARLIVKDAGPATMMAFSPDGRFLALAYRDDDPELKRAELLVPKRLSNREQIRLVRLADGKLVRGFSGHVGDIDCLSFSPNGRKLASGGHDTTVLLWQVPALPDKGSPRLDRRKLAALWEALNRKAAEAHASMATLVAAPAQTVPFLDAKLKPSGEHAQRIAQLLKQLDSAQFREREAALSELKKVGHAVEPALYKTLKDKPSLEVRRRVQQLLDELRGDKSVTGERLRFLRAMEILERIGDKPARKALRRLSEGEAGTWLMDEAKATLQRLQRRSVSAME